MWGNTTVEENTVVENVCNGVRGSFQEAFEGIFNEQRERDCGHGRCIMHVGEHTYLEETLI